MGNGTVVTVSLNPKRVQEIERAGGRGAAVRPETEQPTYPLPGAFAQQPMATQQMQPPVGQMQQPGMLPTQEPQAASMSMTPNMPEAMPLADQDAAAMQQATGAPGGQQMGYQPYQRGYPYQQMPPLGYASSSRSSTSRDISSRTSRCRSSSTTPGPNRCLCSLTNSGLKVFNSKCRRCRVLNNQQLK